MKERQEERLHPSPGEERAWERSSPLLRQGGVGEVVKKTLFGCFFSGGTEKKNKTVRSFYHSNFLTTVKYFISL